jgi:hypothetical protein
VLANLLLRYFGLFEAHSARNVLTNAAQLHFALFCCENVAIFSQILRRLLQRLHNLLVLKVFLKYFPAAALLPCSPSLRSVDHF